MRTLLKKPCTFNLQVGTTSSTAVDPLLELGKVTKVTYLYEFLGTLQLKKLL